MDGEVRGHKSAGDADAGPADAKDEQIDLFRVDAHELRRLFIHRRSLYRPAEAGPLYEPIDGGEHRKGEDAGHKLGNGDDGPADLEGLPVKNGAGEKAEVRREAVHAKIFQEHREAEGGKQRSHRRLAETSLDDPFIGEPSQNKQENAGRGPGK